MPKFEFLNIRINDISKTKLLDEIRNFISADQKSIVSNANIQAANLSIKFPWFRDFLNQSEIVFCDGFGIILGAKILGLDIKHRNTPPDWIPLLAKMCAENNYRLALLGSNPGIAEETAQLLKKDAPTLNIALTHHGYFDKTPGHQENEAVIQAINAAKPDILMVGFGMPLQEKWIMENFERLEVKVVMPVGAAFDYVSGNVRRAPRWMTDHGLEWLGRLIIEPKRLWKRYIIGIPIFFWRVFLQRFGLLKIQD